MRFITCCDRAIPHALFVSVGYKAKKPWEQQNPSFEIIFSPRNHKFGGKVKNLPSSVQSRFSSFFCAEQKIFRLLC